MDRKDRIDAFGATALVGFALLFAINQVVIKVTNGGFQPVFLAALRSCIAIFCILAWMRFRSIPAVIEPGTVRPGLLIGAFFSSEFVFLFLALDLTTVARSSVIFYSMPVWLALLAHAFLPGERLTLQKLAGLALAFAGVIWAIIDRGPSNGEASLAGDLCALGAALSWAGIAVCARGTAMARVKPEIQLMWQVAVSIPTLFGASLFFGPLLRDPGLIHVAGLLFQAIFVVTLGFVGWLWLLSRYPASGVASFSFLTPVFGVALGWALLDEHISGSIIGALVLVTAGVVFINRPAALRTRPV